MKNRKHPFRIFIFLLLIVLPFSAGLLYAVLYSFGLIGILNNGFTFKFWLHVFTDANTWSSLAFSFYVALVSIFFTTLFALLFMICEPERSRTTPFFVFVPLALPAIVAAFFTFQFLSASGWLSRLTHFLHLTHGIENFPDLVNDPGGIGIITTHVLLAVPFFIILFQSYYRTENLKALKNLSATLGGSSTQFYLRILIPVLLRKSSASLLLYFIFMLGSYEIPLLLGKQQPQMISVLISRKLGRYNLADIPEGYIITILYAAIVAALLTFILSGKKTSDVAAD